MKIVIDSNILFRILISGGEILDIYFNPIIKLLAPERLKQEFLNNKKEILSKSKLSEPDFNTLLLLLFEKIEFIPFEEYSLFIPKSIELLKEHKKDEDFVALALSKNLKIWTYENRLFKIGFGISTKQISDQL